LELALSSWEYCELLCPELPLIDPVLLELFVIEESFGELYVPLPFGRLL
jgi:hypothetical protein